MTVFLINDGGLATARKRDYSAARKFGELVLVNDKFLQPDGVDDNDFMFGQLFYNIEQAARQFDPVRDYLLPVGDVVQVIQFVALVATKGIGCPIRVLRYDQEERDYYVVALKQYVSVLA